MQFSLIKILSSLIFIAETHNKIILTILLRDYVKSRVNKTQFIFIELLVYCYKEKNILLNDPVYKILEKYICINEENLCKKLIL